MNDTDRDKYNAEQRRKKDENYDKAIKSFESAKKLAVSIGFSLIQHSPWHFSLTYVKDGERQWRLNLYPRNQRIWSDPACGKTPFLEVPKPWDFFDVVTAAVIKTRVIPERLEKAITG